MKEIKEKIREFFLGKEEYDFENLESYSKEELEEIITEQRETLRAKRKFDIVTAGALIVIMISSISMLKIAIDYSDQLEFSLDYIKAQQKKIDLQDLYIDYLEEALGSAYEFWFDGSQEPEIIWRNPPKTPSEKLGVFPI